MFSSNNGKKINTTKLRSANIRNFGVTIGTSIVNHFFVIFACQRSFVDLSSMKEKSEKEKSLNNKIVFLRQTLKIKCIELKKKVNKDYGLKQKMVEKPQP